MCGITGIISKNEEHHRWLPAMMKCIAHRGPDGEGQWSNSTVSFGHLRLSIIDLSDSATQPMVCQATGNILTFNGEIYNYRELRTELAGHYRFRTDSDTEVILAAYQHWGTDALIHLRGMFALALYDLARQQTLIARDRFGIKPLYYRNIEGSFLFASEIKALLGLPNMPAHSVHLKKVFGFLAHRHLDTDADTFFQEVKQIPPATFVWVDAQGSLSNREKHWDMPLPGEKKFEKRDQAIFRAQLEESVDFHLRSDVPVGSFLSGGLDSSTITCVAGNSLEIGSRLHTFSSILEKKNEENALIEVMHQHLKKAIHHGIQLDGSHFLEELPRVTYHHDEPLADASMYAHWELCKVAQQNNIKVLLSGNGGDEVLGGYASHVYALLGRLLKRGYWSDWRRFLQDFRQNRTEGLQELILRSLQEAAPFTWREQHKRRQSLFASQLLNGNYSRSDYTFYFFKNTDPYTANLFNNMCSWTVPPFLHYEDRNSMAFGVEIRVPMLDHVFVEYVTKHHPTDLLKGRSKQVLRDSMRDIVPDAVLDQKKKYGFAAPLEQFVTYDRSATLRFFQENISKVPFFNQKIATELAEEVLVKNNYARFQYFWRTLAIAVWYNAFFHG